MKVFRKSYLILFIVFCFILSVFCSCKSTPTDPNIEEKEVWVEGQADGKVSFIYVPFDVPQQVKSFSVSIDYEDEKGTRLVEIGLFDPSFSGDHKDQTGFRGWSGTIRKKIFVAEDAATHGYFPGEIAAGKWHVILGGADLGEGLYVTVRTHIGVIDADAKKEYDEENSRKFESRQAIQHERMTTGEYTWFVGDLHSHTYHSDGYWSPKGLIDAAAARNLDFISVTDHNTYSQQPELAQAAKDHPKLLVINGEEVTTHGGHMNVWGLPDKKWIDFRLIPSDAKAGTQIVKTAKSMNALAGINHPLMTCAGCSYTYGGWNSFGVVEVWNAGWDETDDKALEEWDLLTLNQKLLTGIGASDTHQPKEKDSKWGINRPPGSPAVFVAAKSNTQEAILEGIERGRVYVASEPSMKLEYTTKSGAMLGDMLEKKYGEPIEFRFKVEGFEPNYSLRVVANAQVAKEYILDSDGVEGVYQIFANADGFSRIEVRDSAGKLVAFSNPISWSVLKDDDRPVNLKDPRENPNLR